MNTASEKAAANVSVTSQIPDKEGKESVPVLDIPPDVKAAAGSPSKDGKDSKEIAETLFAADPPAETTREKAASPNEEEVSVPIDGKSDPEVKSTSTAPVREAEKRDTEEVSSKIKSKLSWLGLSLARGKQKVEEEGENEKVEGKIEEEGGAKPVESTKKTRSHEDYELVTVGEGVNGVREAESRNFSRAYSFDDDNNNHDYDDDDATEITGNKTVDTSVPDAAQKEKKKQEEISKPPKKKKKKWYKSTPKINLSFNMKWARSSKREVAEEVVPSDLGAPKEREKEKMDTYIATEESKADVSRRPPLSLSGDVAPSKARGDSYNAQETSTIARLVVGFAFLMWIHLVMYYMEYETLSTLSFKTIVDGACAPIPSGAALHKIRLKQSTFEAPWWMPAPLKTDTFFRAVCGGRPRTKLEWTFEKKIKGKRLHSLAIYDVNMADAKNAKLLAEKHLVSATVGPDCIYVSNKKGEDGKLSGPWKLDPLEDK